MKILFVFCFFCLSFNTYPQTFIHYSDLEYHFHILLPEDWETEYLSHHIPFLSKESGVAMFSSFLALDKLTVQTIGCETTFYPHLPKYNTAIHESNIYEIVKDTIAQKDVRRLTFYDKNKYYKYCYEENKRENRILIDAIKMTVLQFVNTHNKDVFVIQFKCPEAKFNDYESLFFKIADSVYFD